MTQAKLKSYLEFFGYEHSDAEKFAALMKELLKHSREAYKLHKDEEQLAQETLINAKETAYFPEYFPKRRTMKYRQDHHRCPFDMGPAGSLGWASGCFYRCYLFNNKEHDVDLMRRMVDKLLEDGNFFAEMEEG